MRASEYPIPDYACYVWHRGDALMVGMPDGRTHVVPIEKCLTDAPGIRFLLDLLNERRNVMQQKQEPQIGTRSEPTEEMIRKAMLASYKVPLTDKVEYDIFATENQEETENA